MPFSNCTNFHQYLLVLTMFVFKMKCLDLKLNAVIIELKTGYPFLAIYTAEVWLVIDFLRLNQDDPLN